METSLITHDTMILFSLFFSLVLLNSFLVSIQLILTRMDFLHLEEKRRLDLTFSHLRRKRMGRERMTQWGTVFLLAWPPILVGMSKPIQICTLSFD